MEGSNRNQLYQIHRRRSRAPGTMRVLLFASMCQASLVHSTASSASCSNDFTTGVEHTSQCSPLADVTHQYDHPSHRQRHRHRHKQVQSQLCFVGARHCFALQPRHGSGSSGGSSKENTCFRTGTSTARCSRKSKLSMGGKSSRGAGKPTGRPASRNGVGKKVRRILEPASPAETAFEEKKEKVSMMNWGKLGRSSRGKGGGARGGGGASATAAGLDAAWIETALPKEGDVLQCKHFKTCPGCEVDREFDKTPIMGDSRSFMDNLHASGARARGGAKASLDFERHVIHDWDPHGWRTVAKLATKPLSKWGGVELGLYKAASHDVTGIPDCRVHHPSVNLAVQVLQASAKKYGVTGFRQDNFDGDLRYVQIAVERTSGQVQLTLVWNEDNYRDATPKLQLLAKDMRSSRPELFHSIWANFRIGPGNAIFSRDPHSWHRCSGPEYLKEIVGPQKIPFFFSPPLFRQGNLDHFERIVEAVVDWVPEGSGVCELYAGVGILGLNCASKASFVRCSDVNAFNPRSFERSRRSLPSKLQSKVSFEAMTAEEAIEDGESEDCEVLIVDPPRKGLDPGVIEALTDPEEPYTAALRRVVYVSCGFDALKRDAMSLISGGWTLRHSEGFVLFPGSDHVETLAIFDR